MDRSIKDGRRTLESVDLDGGFRIGEWEIRPRLGTLARADVVNRIEPRVMAVLVCLARSAPNVVTRDEFIRDVWQGRVVTDEVLSRCISLLRTALDEQARESRFIQTLPRIGYRLLVAVDAIGTIEPAAAAVGGVIGLPVRSGRSDWSPIDRRGFPVWAIVVMCVIVAVPFLLYDHFRPPDWERNTVPTATRHSSIAVLPFVDRSDAPEDGYFADGLSEEVIARLSAINGLNVVASTSAFRFKERPADVRKIGEKLGVQYLVEGNVRRDGERVRITAQLIDAHSGFHLLSQTYEGAMTDIFALQDDVSDGIAKGLAAAVPGIATDPYRRPSRPTQSVDAYDLVLRGRNQFRIREEDHIRRAIALFERACALDPRYSEAYADLARAQVVLPFYSSEDPERMFAVALDNLQRGARIDPGLLESSQDVVAFVEQTRWHWHAAEAAYSRALQARPRDSNLLQWYSQFLATVGRTRESLRFAQTARQMDVISPVVNDRLAVAYMWNDQDELAARQFEVSRELGIRIAAQPETYLLLLLRLKRYDEARALILALQGPSAPVPGWLDPFLAALVDPRARPAAVRALSAAQREHAIPLRHAIGAWMKLGEDERALDGILQLMQDPRRFEEELLFASEARGVRQRPGFVQVVQRMGLVDYWDATAWPDACHRVDGVISCR